MGYNPDVALGNHHLLQLEPWYDQWLLPCFQAYYRYEIPELRELIAVAREQLARESFSADERRALEYELAALQYYYDTLSLPTEHFVNAVNELLARAVLCIHHSPAGPLSRTVQAYWLLAFCGMGVRRGYFDLPQAEYDAYFEVVPPAQRTQLLWFFVAIRAYYHNDLHYLALACEAHSTEPTGFRDEFFWGSSRLMYRLCSGEATPQDVHDFIRSFEHPNAVRDFRNLFQQRCTEQGIYDGEAEALLLSAESQLTALEGTFPRPFRRNQSMLENKAIYSLTRSATTSS